MKIAAEQVTLNIAKAVAHTLNLSVLQALSPSIQKGTSHPKSNLKRAKMLQFREVPGSAVPVDDFATLGVPLSEARKILTANGTDSLVIAWIVGEPMTNVLNFQPNILRFLSYSFSNLSESNSSGHRKSECLGGRLSIKGVKISAVIDFRLGYYMRVDELNRGARCQC